MKTLFYRVWTVGLAVPSLVFCLGCAKENLSAAEEAFTTPLLSAAQPSGSPAEPPEASPANTNATNIVVVRAATLPENVQVSPELTEIVKLVQAGIGEEVILSYITNSTNAYGISSDEIVYLNDLGVSSEVITALIERDNRPEALEMKRAASAASPLPSGVALHAPATNIYPGSITFPAAEPGGPGSGALPPEDAGIVYADADYGYENSGAASHFYDSLAPYGNWVSVPEYGLCWQPTVAVHNSYWRPYSDHGRWLWSDAGWYWYSDYSWGWAPFHYGRWHSYPSVGWLWVPGTTWGPSWVSWRYTPRYCGWAPLPPAAHYVSGAGFSYYGRSVSFGFGFGLGAHHYTFLPFSRFCDPRPFHHFVSPSHARTIFNDSTVINNYIVGDNNTIINQGFGLEPVRRVSRTEIRKARLADAPVAGDLTATRRERLVVQGDSMTVVRPTLAAAREAGGRGAAKRPEIRGTEPVASAAPAVIRSREERPALSGAGAGNVGVAGSPARPTLSRPLTGGPSSAIAARSERAGESVPSISRPASGSIARGENGIVRPGGSLFEPNIVRSDPRPARTITELSPITVRRPRQGNIVLGGGPPVRSQPGLAQRAPSAPPAPSAGGSAVAPSAKRFEASGANSRIARAPFEPVGRPSSSSRIGSADQSALRPDRPSVLRAGPESFGGVARPSRPTSPLPAVVRPQTTRPTPNLRAPQPITSTPRPVTSIPLPVMRPSPQQFGRSVPAYRPPARSAPAAPVARPEPARVYSPPARVAPPPAAVSRPSRPSSTPSRATGGAPKRVNERR